MSLGPLGPASRPKRNSRPRNHQDSREDGGVGTRPPAQCPGPERGLPSRQRTQDDGQTLVGGDPHLGDQPPPHRPTCSDRLVPLQVKSLGGLCGLRAGVAASASTWGLRGQQWARRDCVGSRGPSRAEGTPRLRSQSRSARRPGRGSGLWGAEQEDTDAPTPHPEWLL